MRLVRYDNFETQVAEQVLPVMTEQGPQEKPMRIITFMEKDGATVHQFVLHEEHFQQVFRQALGSRVQPASMSDLSKLPKMPGQ